jgi:GTP-binding protein
MDLHDVTEKAIALGKERGILQMDDYAEIVGDAEDAPKGEMKEMGPAEGSEGQTQLRFVVPTRGMIGIRSALLTATKGTLVLDTIFDSYRPVVGAITQREKGSLLAFEDGATNPFGIIGAQDRGRLFIGPKTDVYKDMIIGVHQRPGDLAVNICKTKETKYQVGKAVDSKS